MAILLSGLPGKMGSLIAEALFASGRSIVPFALTAEEFAGKIISIHNHQFELLAPSQREKKISQIKNDNEQLIAIDFSVPAAVVPNVDFYCRHNIPFVLGTTGAKREDLVARVAASKICALISPNMAKQIVLIQAVLEHTAKNYPGVFSNYLLSISESHQSSKIDTSGTALAFSRLIEQLGTGKTRITSIRQAEEQLALGVPSEHLSGHAWHTYQLELPDSSASFSLSHNINGRKIYVDGTLEALDFLMKQVNSGVSGKTFSMLDVLSQGHVN